MQFNFNFLNNLLTHTRARAHTHTHTHTHIYIHIYDEYVQISQ